MALIRLKYKCITEIVGTDHMGIIVLVNDDESLQVSIPCGKNTTFNFSLRHFDKTRSRRLLPEVLVHLLKENTDLHLEIRIEDIINGEYISRIYDTDTSEIIPIVISDAVLLSVIADIPLFIDEQLMQRQSATFDENSAGLKLPINALSQEMLEDAIKKAVGEEQYELAAILKKEIERRKSKDK